MQQRLERLPEAERTSEKVSVIAHACQVPLRLLRRAQAAEKKLGIPPTESDSFAVFAGLKKASGLGAAEMGQRVVFQLGDKYRAEYPFISEFLGCYRQRVDNLRAALRRLREILPEREGP